MAKRAKRRSAKQQPGFDGREIVVLDDGRELAYYDPTEAVEEHHQSKLQQKTLGGLAIDEGTVLEPDEQGSTGANRSGKVVAIPKIGQEEVFAHLEFQTVAPGAAEDVDSAMHRVREYMERIGLTRKHFQSFTVTTHYYLAPLGKRECGWSFSFESTPFSFFPTVEEH